MGGSLSSIDVADALLDERRELTEQPARLRAWRPQLALGHKGTGSLWSASDPVDRAGAARIVRLMIG